MPVTNLQFIHVSHIQDCALLLQSLAGMLNGVMEWLRCCSIFCCLWRHDMYDHTRVDLKAMNSKGSQPLVDSSQQPPILVSSRSAGSGMSSTPSRQYEIYISLWSYTFSFQSDKCVPGWCPFVTGASAHVVQTAWPSNLHLSSSRRNSSNGRLFQSPGDVLL